MASGGPGSNNADVMHREVSEQVQVVRRISLIMVSLITFQILDGMLASTKWSHLAAHYHDVERETLVGLWHKLDGLFPRIC